MRAALLVVLALLVPAGAAAQGLSSGLYLFWDRCYTAGGTVTKTFACDSNTGPVMAMYASVVIPADMPQFAAASVIVDVYLSGGTISPWWQTRTGQCRAGAITASFDWPALDPSECMNIWQSTPLLSVMQVLPGISGPDMLRISSGAAVPAGSELVWVADGTELVVARIAISRAKTVGADACPGCVGTACFSYTESKLQQPAGIGDYTITNWGGYATGYAYLHGSSGSLAPQTYYHPCFTSTPSRSWGAIKGMYR